MSIDNISAIGKTLNTAVNRAKGIGNLSDNFKISFIKNDYRPEKTQRKEILNRILKNTSLSDEVGMSNEDIVMALYNINQTSKIDSKIPKINSTLFKDMLSQFLIKPPKDVEYLKNLSVTQEKIYKILFKIEDELIDEQDTSIEDKSKDDFLKRLEDLLKSYNISQLEETTEESDFGFLDMLGLGNIGKYLMKPFKYIFDKTKNALSSISKAVGKGLEKVGKWVGKAFPNLSKYTSQALNSVKNAFSKVGMKIASATSFAGKALNTVKAGLGKVFKFMGKHAFKLIEFVRIGYYITCYWKESEKHIEEPGCIEKLIFSVISGITEWVKEYIDLIDILGKFLEWCFDVMKEAFDLILDKILELDSNIGNLFKSSFKTIIDLLPINVINKYIISPVIEFLKNNGTYGADCGVIAIQIYREFKNEIMNAIPNTSTLNLLFGNDEDLENIQKKGLYTWNKLGESSVNASAETLAKLSTVQELKKILEHGDISSFDKQKVEKAIKLIESGESQYNDENLKSGKGDTVLIELTEKIRKMPSNSLTPKWLELAEKSIIQSMVEPTSCMVEYHKDKNGKEFTLTPHTVLGHSESGLFSNIYDIPKDIINSVLDVLKKQNIDFKLYKETDNMFFTAYGTFFIASWEFDIMKSEEMLKIVKKPYKNKQGRMGLFYKIVGHFSDSGIFKLNEIAKGDRCVEKYCEHNILTTSEIAEKKTVANSVERTDTVVSKILSDKPFEMPKPQINFGNSNVVPSNQIVSVPKITKNEAKDKTWEFFKKLGFLNEQTAGIMGNLQVESGFGESIYKVHNDVNGPSGGLCQWHDTESKLGKGRLSNLLKFAGWTNQQINNYYIQIKQNKWKGELPVPLETQLAFLSHELNTTHKGALQEIQKSSNVLDSARAWVYKYEFPQNKEIESRKRGMIGLGFLKEYANGEEHSTQEPSVQTPISNAQEPITDVQKSSVQTPTSIVQNQISNVQEPSETSKKPVEMASDIARQNAENHSVGRCARYVANSLQEVGFNFPRQSSAYMYHTKGILKDMGFGLVSQGQKDYTPQKGDVCVINKFGNHQHGHICIYDGKNWVSDFIQKNPSPYRQYPGDSNMLFYRYGGSNIEIASTDNGVSVDNYGTNDVFTPEINSDNIQQTSENSVIVNNNQKDNIEYEGQSENLFSLKYADILI